MADNLTKLPIKINEKVILYKFQKSLTENQQDCVHFTTNWCFQLPFRPKSLKAKHPTGVDDLSMDFKLSQPTISVQLSTETAFEGHRHHNLFKFQFSSFDCGRHTHTHTNSGVETVNTHYHPHPHILSLFGKINRFSSCGGLKVSVALTFLIRLSRLTAN